MKRAHKNRNSNSIIHSSSDIAKRSRTKEKIKNSINDLETLLENLIWDYIKL